MFGGLDYKLFILRIFTWSHIVTIPPRPPPEYVNFFEQFHFFTGDQLVVPLGASHISS